MKIEYVAIKDISPYPNNPRDNSKSLKNVANSIKEFGFNVPIILDDKNVVIAGHTRLEAAKQLGYAQVPAIRVSNLTESQINAYRLVDNRTAEMAEWDFEKLKKEIMGCENIDMSLFGFDKFGDCDIDGLFEQKGDNDGDGNKDGDCALKSKQKEIKQDVYKTHVCPCCGVEFKTNGKKVVKC